MAHDPRWLRESGRLVSSLLQTPDDGLDDFLRERLSQGGAHVVTLRHVRQILVHASEALLEPSAERAQGIAHARQLLEDWEQGRRRIGDSGASASSRADAAQPAASSASAAASSPAASAPMRAPAIAPSAALAGGPLAPSPWLAGAAVSAPVIAFDEPPRHAPLAFSSPASAAAPEPPPAAAPQAPPAVVPAPTPRRFSLEPMAELGATAPVTAAAARRPSLPFASNAPPSSQAAPPSAPPPASAPAAAQTLPLEQYARMRAEHAIWPDHAAHIRQRYGLDESEERRTEQHYREALAADAALQQRYDQLFAMHRKQLVG